MAAGASADVLAIDAHRVLKLFRREVPREAILREVAHARWARLQGLPVAQALDVVEHGDRTGIVFERRDGPTVFTLLCTGEREPAELATLFFRLQQRIHHAPCNLLPPAQPALARRIAAAAVDDDIKTLALRVAQARSARNGACHGDFHPLNVILWQASPVVVDWMDAGCGDPALDVTRTLLFLLYAHSDTIAADTRDQACHNPRLVLAPPQRAALSARLGEIGIEAGMPFWLFVLSGMDYRVQCQLLGRTRLDARLQALGRQTRAAGCQPVFIVPPLACESLAGEAGGAGLILAYCDHLRFRALLLHAQHLFYWNLLSNSVLARVANGGSVFFFDDGHLARFVPTLLPVALEGYYRNARLPRLDPIQALDARALAKGAADQPATFALALQALRALPTPDQWFERLLEKVQP